NSVILLVDDKPANLLALENMLLNDGREILLANSGKEALNIVLKKEIDLIILDVRMPEMDGFEVAQILKSNNRTKNIPIIFASAEKREYSSVLQGYDEGALDYLLKPLDPSITRAKVAILLELQFQKKELLEKNISLQKSELLINNSADIIGIIDIETLSFEKINAAFTNILGYTLEEIEGKDITFFLHEKEVDFFKKYLKSKDDNLSAETRTNQYLIGNSKDANQHKLSFETRVVCKDKSSKWLSWNVVSKFGKWFFNARNITEVKESDKIKEFLAAQVKHSNNAIYIHDESGKIISWNLGAEEIYGYKESEALKMEVWELLPENIRSEAKDRVSKILSGEKKLIKNLITEFETSRITKDGKKIIVLFSASFLTDYTGERKSFAIKERDITQQKLSDLKITELNDELKKNVLQLESSNKELESFSYSVSHDLRAPLRAVNSYIKIIEEDYSQILDEDAMKLVQNINSNAGRMGVLIEDLLAFSRLGRKEVEKEAVDFQKLIETILFEINTVEKHKIAIKIGTLEPTLADVSLLRQVWTNLLSNAIKYSSKKEKPEIEIGSSVLDNEVMYFVKDNGAGFNMEYSNKLFGVFQRLHSSNEFEGTGIGLAIAHRIVSKHGGRIWAESKINEGATFYFTMPQKTSMQ
ncbi:MAG: PAS domain S-box protein, partial [Bacteroidetes bacterium]|nr:PAS domain S-box protein [Bacteroidota bacterium]